MCMCDTLRVYKIVGITVERYVFCCYVYTKSVFETKHSCHKCNTMHDIMFYTSISRTDVFGSADSVVSFHSRVL